MVVGGCAAEVMSNHRQLRVALTLEADLRFLYTFLPGFDQHLAIANLRVCCLAITLHDVNAVIDVNHRDSYIEMLIVFYCSIVHIILSII